MSSKKNKTHTQHTHTKANKTTKKTQAALTSISSKSHRYPRNGPQSRKYQMKNLSRNRRRGGEGVKQNC